MRIVRKTNRDYAHIEWGSKKEELLRALEKTVLHSPEVSKSLKGLRIEISKDDLVPQEVRNSLKDGRFFLVEH